MQLTLDDHEKLVLEDTLEAALRRVREEVHHTHTPDFKDDLREEERVLRSMLSKLRGTN